MSDFMGCSIQTLAKHDLLNETAIIDQFIHNGTFHKLKNANLSTVKDIVSTVAHPFAIKLFNTTGSDLVKTMPPDMLKWIQVTAYTLDGGKLEDAIPKK